MEAGERRGVNKKKGGRLLRSRSAPGTLRAMEVKLKYRGRAVTDREVEFIRELIARHPGASRRVLSEKLCEAWDWRQPNGVLRDMQCRGLMLALHRAGFIELPSKRCSPPNPLAVRRKPSSLSFLTWSPVEGSLSEIRPLKVLQVRRRDGEGLFASLMETHHYLGYTQPVGEHLKYVIYARGTPVALAAFSSAPRHLGPRDRFLGWSKEERRRNIHLLAYNTRFLILPWVRVRHLASHLLARLARVISADWEELYQHPIYFLETFIDPERYPGTCYRAANWIYLGKTTGRGKDDQTWKPNRSLKEVWGYPLRRDFRKKLKRSGLAGEFSRDHRSPGGGAPSGP